MELGARFELLDRLDARAAGSSMQPTPQLLDGIGRASRRHLHRAVGQVARVPRKLQPLRFEACAVPKVNALHPARDAKAAIDLTHNDPPPVRYRGAGPAPGGDSAACAETLSAAVAWRFAASAASRARTYSRASRCALRAGDGGVCRVQVR